MQMYANETNMKAHILIQARASRCKHTKANFKQTQANTSKSKQMYTNENQCKPKQSKQCTQV